VRPLRRFCRAGHNVDFCRDLINLRDAWRLRRQGQFLKQAEQFEDDYDNNNYSDYVEDASVHAVTDIRLRVRRPIFLGINDVSAGRITGKKSGEVAFRRSLIQGTITQRLGCLCEGLSSAALLTALWPPRS